MTEKPKIAIPESGYITKKEAKQRFRKIDQILIVVIIAVVLATISALVSVFGIFIDQLRYNNAAYREYSDRIKLQDELKADISKNQEVLMKQQKEIKDILSTITKQ